MQQQFVVYDILISILKDEVRCKSFSKQFLLLDRPFGLRPYGQPGPLPIMVTLVALLIELEAQIL